MPVVAVYCTRSTLLYAKNLDTSENRIYELNKIGPNDLCSWTSPALKDRFVKVMRRAFKFNSDNDERNTDHKLDCCDKLLILNNQDNFNAIKEMFIHVEMNGYAKKFKTVPSIIARLNFVTHVAKDKLIGLINGDKFMVITLHHEGYEMFLLGVYNENYVIIDNGYSPKFEGSYNYYEKVTKQYPIQRVFIVGQKCEVNDNLSKKFVGSFYISYDEYEKIIYQGGIAKLEASYKKSGEVLDIPPLVCVEYADNQGQRRKFRLLGPNLANVFAQPNGKISAYEIKYQPEICYVNKNYVTSQSSVIVPNDKSSYVDINASVNLNGLLNLNVTAYDDSYFEFCDLDEISPRLNNVDKFADNFNIEVKRKNINEYVEPVKEKQCSNDNVSDDKGYIVYSLKKDAVNEYISCYSIEDREQTVSDNDKDWKPIRLLINEKSFTNGLSALEGIHFHPAGVAYYISELLGLTIDEVKFNTKWKFLLNNTDDNGNLCFLFNNNDYGKVNVSPVFILALIFASYKRKLIHDSILYKKTIIELQKDMFTSKQINFILLSAGLAKLNVEFIKFI